MLVPPTSVVCDRRALARSVGAGWIASAVALVVLAFVLRRDPRADSTLFAAVTVAAAAVGVALITAPVSSKRALQAVSLVAAVLVAAAVFASADATGPYAFFATWATALAFAVVPARHLPAHLVAVVGAYAAAFAVTPAHEDRPPAAALVLGAIAATAVFASAWRRHRVEEQIAGAVAERRDPHRDAVTNLLNAEALETAFRLELARAERGKRPLSLIFFCLDGLTAIEERYGADGRDAVLASAARALESSCRLTDVAVRAAATRFAVLLPETDADGALLAAGRLRRTLSEVTLVGEEGDDAAPGPLTASIGLATFPQHGSTAAALTTAAERGLVSASYHGGDRAEAIAV